MSFIMGKTVGNLFESQIGVTVYNTALSAISRHGMRDMLSSGVLVAFSGGADSVMALLFLCEYRRRECLDFPILAVHVNHMIRGVEADRDEAFSRDLANTLDVEFVSRKIDVPKLAKETGKGVEEAARNARYFVFSDIIQSRNDIATIVTAHNATDNAETVIFNITRGSGSRGACGIAPVRGNVIRPLIYASGKIIRDALDAAGIEYVYDSTNDSNDYSRNYIRHEILPRLAELNPQYVAAFSAFSDSVRGDLDYISGCASEVFSATDGRMDRSTLRGLHSSVFAQVITQMAADAGIGMLERKHILAISNLLAKDNFRYSVGGGLSFVCERGNCYFAPDSPRATDFYQELHEGTNKLLGYCAEIYIGDDIPDDSSSNVYKFSIQADMSSAIIVGGLYVRLKQDGDSYFYGGMTRKLKKVFNDRGIPPSVRARIPVICDDKGVVWVPGLPVRDDGAPRGLSSTKKITFSVISQSPEEELFAAK